jgi:hypothetical protein
LVSISGETMTYQVGDLLDDDQSGLGYVSGIMEDIIQITWFGRPRGSHPSYHYENVDRWIKYGYAIHYPIGKQ